MSTTSSNTTTTSSNTTTTSSQTNQPPQQQQQQNDSKKSVATDFVIGDWFSRVSYCQIKEEHNDKFVIENEAGHSWSISKNIVEREGYSATQFDL